MSCLPGSALETNPATSRVPPATQADGASCLSATHVSGAPSPAGRTLAGVFTPTRISCRCAVSWEEHSRQPAHITALIYSR